MLHVSKAFFSPCGLVKKKMFVPVDFFPNHQKLSNLEIPELVGQTVTYNSHVKLCKPVFPVKQQQIFTKQTFGSDLHNTYQRSALVSQSIKLPSEHTAVCNIILDGKKRKSSKTHASIKIKQNTRKERVKLLFSLSVGSFFLQKKPLRPS